MQRPCGMLGKINSVLNVLIGSCIGLFAGRTAYAVWDCKAHTDAYAAQSAPWWAGVLVFGALVAAVATLALVAKLIVRRKMKG